MPSVQQCLGEMGLEIAQKWNFTLPPVSHLHLSTGEYTHIHPETQPHK